jgi:hypothetical protein
MRKVIFAVLAVSLVAAAPRGTIALGVGASSSSEVVVKIDGKNATVKLAGVNNGTYAGQAFLQCLVANRVLHVDRAAGRVTLLDGTSVADHVAEFLQTRTATDPCALGKAAYVPLAPPLAASVTVAHPGAPATKQATPAREVHVSFGSTGATMKPEALAMPLPSTAQPTTPRKTTTQQRPTYSDQPSIYRPPTVGTMTPQSGTAYTPPTAGTSTVPSSSTVTPGQGQTYTPPTVNTTTVPTTSTSPP